MTQMPNPNVPTAPRDDRFDDSPRWEHVRILKAIIASEDEERWNYRAVQKANPALTKFIDDVVRWGFCEVFDHDVDANGDFIGITRMGKKFLEDWRKRKGDKDPGEAETAKAAEREAQVATRRANNLPLPKER